MKTLEQKVMSRIRRIYYLRTLTGPTALKAYALGALGVWLVSLVSVMHVVANMPSPLTPTSLVRFFTAAALHTEFVVQLVLLGVVVLVVFVVRDMVQHLHKNESLFVHA